MALYLRGPEGFVRGGPTDERRGDPTITKRGPAKLKWRFAFGPMMVQH